MERLIFHVDVNSAYLSWEAVRQVKAGKPDLRQIPSCIGGSPESRHGIVLAKSIPAKKFNIRTAEPLASALRKCPKLVIVPPDFKLYVTCSQAFKGICRSYAPVVEEFSIDECFLDMSGTEGIYADPPAIAWEIKNKIRDELGFTVNVGVARNKLCAKMASDFEKPDKVHTLFPEEIPEKLWPLPVKDLLFIGGATAQKLERAYIKTIGQLAQSPVEEIQRLLGNKPGLQAHRYANGIDNSPVSSEREKAKSYSNSVTLEQNVTTLEMADAILLSLADSVASHMRADGMRAHCVSVGIRYLDFKTRSRQRTLDAATDTTRRVYELSKQLLRELWQDRKPLRLMSITLSDLAEGEEGQISLFQAEGADQERHRKQDAAVDSIRKRFGYGMIQRGSAFESGIIAGRKFRAQEEADEK